jgi:hypothetical protein
MLARVKLLFKPVGLVGGMVAGLIATKLFEVIWGAIDDEEPPEPDQRRVSPAKLAAALALEGAIFRVTRGFVDRGARWVFEVLSGKWPGDEAPEPR